MHLILIYHDHSAVSCTGTEQFRATTRWTKILELGNIYTLFLEYICLMTEKLPNSPSEQALTSAVSEPSPPALYMITHS
jgi:hypothetical protein